MLDYYAFAGLGSETVSLLRDSGEEDKMNSQRSWRFWRSSDVQALEHFRWSATDHNSHQTYADLEFHIANHFTLFAKPEASSRT